MPGLRLATTKRPLTSDCTLYWRPVATSFTLTAAPGMAAAEGSVTVPAKVPVGLDCAQADPTKMKNEKRDIHNTRVFIILLCSVLIRSPCPWQSGLWSLHKIDGAGAKELHLLLDFFLVVPPRPAHGGRARVAPHRPAPLRSAWGALL